MHKLLVVMAVIVLAVQPLFPAYGFASSQNEKILSFDAKEKAIPGEVIVKYKEGRDGYYPRSLQKLNKAFGSRYQSKKISKHGTFVYAFPEDKPLDEVIDTLSEDPNVEYIEPVYPIYAADMHVSSEAGTDDWTGRTDEETSLRPARVVFGDPYFGDQQGYFDVIGRTLLQQDVTEQDLAPLTVAVIDTGVDLQHEDLQASIVAGYDFVDGDNDPDDDEDGHGTHVAGIIAALDNNGIGVAGVASGTKLMPIRVLGPEGGTTADLASGIDWAVSAGADLINLSLGGEMDSRAVHDAVRHAVNGGVLVIAAAGNESSAVVYPAAYEEVVAVAALMPTRNGLRAADFSNYGSEIDVSAPGVSILSTLPNNIYGYADGTSMAAPIITGLAALLLAEDRWLTQMEAREKAETLHFSLTEAVYDLGDPGFDIYTGYGLVDATYLLESPRPEFSAPAETVVGDAVELGIRLTDARGTVKTDVYRYQELYASIMDPSSNLAALDEFTIPFEVENGEGYVVYKPTVPGMHYIGTWEGMTAKQNETQLWIDGTIALAVKPNPPVASIASGIYRTAQSVSLTVEETAGTSAIYYTLDGSTPDPYTSSVYQGPIAIDRSTVIHAISVQNGMVSGMSSFSYTVGGDTPAPGTGDEPPEPERKVPTVVDGQLNFTVSQDSIQDQLNDPNSTSIVIEIDTDHGKLYDSLNVSLPTAAFLAGKELVIRTDAGDFAFPAHSVDQSIGLETLNLRVHMGARQTGPFFEEASRLSVPYELSLLAGEKVMDRLRYGVQITVPYEGEAVNTEKVAVYGYDAEDDRWLYMGGTLNDNGTMTFTLHPFVPFAVMEYTRVFTDTFGHWAKADIDWLAMRQMVEGTSKSLYSPKRQVTRAEFAALVTRALDLPAVDRATTLIFEDIKQGVWYADAVGRIYEAGIVKGVSERQFAPDRFISREQMAVMLVQAYGYAKGIDPAAMGDSQQTEFVDENQASLWSREAVRAVDELGLMAGDEQGRFLPKQGASRAETAAVVHRLMNLLAER
ncbi:S8 family serine peptidase [Marinicrinis lubricantis]|uniref:S8 family serine peptidase n=1 Tax=Marinicrinis lubricantis TaxID=2086470 RepID=A0ABW1IT21_9BACL